jgi:diguanylate cyclase (GGDEF)-like protein/PAS domain S-box-containing protein
VDARRISAGRIAFIYATFAALWVLLSDRTLGLLVADREMLVALSTAKGWLFVAITAPLLYGLVSRLVLRLQAESARREKDLQDSRRRFAAFIEQAPAALAMFDGEMRYIAASDRWRHDYRIGDREIVGVRHAELGQDVPMPWKDAFPAAMGGKTLSRAAEKICRENGAEQWIRWEVRPCQLHGQSIEGVVVFSEDITERKHAEAELEIAAAAFASQQAVFITDCNGIILRVNRAFEEVTGYAAIEVVGKTPKMLQSGWHDQAFYADLWASLKTDHWWRGEIWNRRKNGEIYPEELIVSAVLDERGDVIKYVASFTDISGHKHAEATIHSLSFYDPLTGLPNRRLALDRLQHDLASAHRATLWGAVLVVNLDRFSLVNDTRSRQSGDDALMETAQRIVDCISTGDTAGRLGGDEFIVLIGELGTERNRAALLAGEMAERILVAIKAPMSLDDGEHVVTACIGVTLFRKDTGDYDDLLKQAHVALHQAKRAGPGSVHFFDMDMQTALERRVTLEYLLRSAIPAQLAVHYQAQVDLSGHISGAEALIRWHHPDKGPIPPGDFIPVAEETGMIVPIGTWVLETACGQLKSWARDAQTRELTLSVNVSAKQLMRQDFVPEVIEIVERTGANPFRLKLELTESTLFTDVDAVTAKMAALKSRGIRFSLDDFGTGFSSLTCLRRMPLDQLKIDQSFVSEVESNANDAAIARTIIALGNSMGLAVIAEGVETEEQRSFLAVHGCTAYQGFLFGRPSSIGDLERKIRSAGETLH